MYVPASFKEERVPVLHDAIRRIKVGTLVTLGSEGLEASPLPMLIEPEPAPYGTLIGHLARANPQWKRAASEPEALVTFLGPNAYVTPSWYAAKRDSPTPMRANARLPGPSPMRPPTTSRAC
jgi:transcriptional regulator